MWSELSSNISLLILTAHRINSDFKTLNGIIKSHTFAIRVIRLADIPDSNCTVHQ